MLETRIIPSNVFVREIESGLHTKIMRLGSVQAQPRHALILLQDGSARLETAQGSQALDAPCLFWFTNTIGGQHGDRPMGDGGNARLILLAGATGFVAEIPEDIVSRAVGDFAEAAVLRHMVDADQHIQTLPDDAGVELIVGSLGAMISEIERSEDGMAMLLIAHIRIILVALMRLSGASAPQFGAGGSSGDYLLRFRQLVEANFRAHWSIGDYARRIGISHDRLHAICRRELHKTPKALVAERLAREAGLGLERSTLTIEQLSHALGFRDPAHFSHFFKRVTGLSPGRFRKLMAASAIGHAPSPANFSDWP